MSFQAVTWAIEQKTGSPSAKATLWSIANYANDFWCAYPKQSTIAKDSEQSTDSVGKRVADLVDAGLLRRIKLKRFGRRTHDFIILARSELFEASLEEIRPHFPAGCDILEEEKNAAADCGSDKNDSPAVSPQDSAIDATANSGYVFDATLPQSAVDAAALVRQQEPVIEPLENPQTPFEASGESQGQSKGEATADCGKERIEKFIARFRSIYPLPCSNPDRFAEDVGQFSETECAQCLHGAAGVAERYRKNPKEKGFVGPNRFVRSSALWAEFSRFAPPDKTPPPRVFIAVGSSQWNARAVIRAICGEKMPIARLDEKTGERGADFLGDLPASGLLLGQFADQFGDVDIRQWVDLDAEYRKQQIAAWVERIFECTGQRIAPGLIYLDGVTTHTMPDGKTFQARKRFTGLRVPSQWPPAKGGNSSILSEADEKEFIDTS